MNRLIEILALSVGGVSLFVVAFVGFASLSGRDVSQVAVIGKLFPQPEEDAQEAEPVAEPADEGRDQRGLSDAAVVEASLGMLSAWTLPSPYSTSELRVLSEDIKKRRAKLEEREQELARREASVQDDELRLEERRKLLEEMRRHLESLQAELSEREVELGRRESAAAADDAASWNEVAKVLAAVEDTAEAAQRLQEYEPAEAARILRALGDDGRASEILNAVEGARWKEYVDAYSAEMRSAARKKKK